MTVANRLKFTVAITSAATITPPTSPNVAGYRTLAQAIAATDLAANTTGVPLICEDASGNWEESYHTVSADGLSFTRTSVAASSAGGTTPATFTGTVTVYCTMFADYVNKLLTSTNGVTLAGLTGASSLSGSTVFECSNDGGATSLTATLTQIAAAVAAINGGAAAAPTETLTIGAIASPQTVGTGFTVSGTWTNVQPTGLNFALTDNGGTQGAFNTATGAVINANGTWSFTQNPSSASTSRTMVVQDSSRTTVVSAPSNAYVVNAAAGTAPGAPTIGTAVAGDGYVDVAFTAGTAGSTATLDYTATLSTGQTTTGTTSPIRVTAPNGTAVTATVKARNSVGLSAASAASNSVTPAAAGGTNVAHTFTRYNGGSPVAANTAAVAATLSRTDVGAVLNDGSGTPYAQFVGTKLLNSETYWGITPQPVPNIAYIGWGSSNSTPPTQLADAQTDSYAQYAMLPGGCMIIGGQQGAIAGGGRYFSSNQAVVYVPNAAGTYNRYMWIKPSDGPAYCINPSNPVVITLS